MPDPQGRVSLRGRIAARTGLAAVARALSDYATACVPTGTDQHAEPGEWIVMARRVSLLAQEVKFRAVVMARESGASWEDVACALHWRNDRGLPDAEAVRDVYEEPYEAWRAGGSQTWTPEGCTPVAPDADDDPARVAASLDHWYAARTGVLIPGLRPVSDGLGLA